MKNVNENENLFTVGLLSAVKYEDVRIELCKEILSNPGAYNDTKIGDPHVFPPRPPRKDNPRDPGNNDPGNDDPTDPDSNNPKKPPVDPEREKQEYLHRKNNFRLKFDKKLTKDCPKNNKTEKPFDDNPPVDPIPPIVKPEVKPFPIIKVTSQQYRDDAIEELWFKMRPILESLRNLKSMLIINIDILSRL